MILNRQKKIRIPVTSLQLFLEEILRELHIASAEVDIAMVSNSEIARWNRQFRHKTGPTDVLSFPSGNRRGAARFQESTSRRQAAHPPSRRVSLTSARKKPAPAAGGGFLGDIAIAPETARRNAAENGRTLDTELRILMLHGLLHLLGYDHETDLGQMDRIERRLRRRLGIA